MGRKKNQRISESIFNLYAGLIALVKGSTEIIVPTLKSIFEKSSNVTLSKSVDFI